MTLSVNKEDFAQWRDNPVTLLFFEFLKQEKEDRLSELMHKYPNQITSPVFYIGELRGKVSVLDMILNIQFEEEGHNQ